MTSQSKRERRKVLVAVIASLVLHVVVALSVAAFNRAPASLPAEEDRPVQLTMVDLPAVAAATPRANPAYMETDRSRETAEQPKEKTFESNANSIAASNLPATGDAPLPSQEGRERPFVDLQTQQASIPTDGSQSPLTPQPTPVPQPTVAPTPVATPEPRASEPPKQTPAPTATPAATSTPEPLATPEPDKLAMLTSTPPPAIRDTEEPTPTPAPDVPPTPPPVTERPRPEAPASGYQPQKQETQINGSISNRGRSSVNAVATPLGKYQKLVQDAVGARWYFYIKNKMDLASIGTARIAAEVDRTGKVTNLRVVSNSANETFANVCLQSFQDAQIPPIPPDLVATLPDGKLPVEFSFILFPN